MKHNRSEKLLENVNFRVPRARSKIAHILLLKVKVPGLSIGMQVATSLMADAKELRLPKAGCV